MATQGVFWITLSVTLLLAASGLIAAILIVTRALRSLGGWHRLAERHPAPGPPPAADLLERQTMRIGTVRYRRCVTAGIEAAGLYLAVRLPRHGAVWIPWSEFRQGRAAKLFMRPAWQLTIGEPQVAAVTLPFELVERLRPHLDAGLLPAAG